MFRIQDQPTANQPTPNVSLKSCGKQMYKWISEYKMFIEGYHQWKVKKKESSLRQEKALDHNKLDTC